MQEIEEPSTKVTVDSKQKLITYERGVLPGFRIASNAEYQPERYDLVEILGYTHVNYIVAFISNWPQTHLDDNVVSFILS